jgi:hypothetical protein
LFYAGRIVDVFEEKKKYNNNKNLLEDWPEPYCP